MVLLRAAHAPRISRYVFDFNDQSSRKRNAASAKQTLYIRAITKISVAHVTIDGINGDNDKKR